MTADPSQISDVLGFWFGELEEKQWWSRSREVDEAVRKRFGTLHEALAQDVPSSWQETPQGYLAAVIVLDQFSRNLFRDDPRSYATDAVAVTLAREAIGKGFDRKLGARECVFLYMPFQHSEDAAVQAESVERFEQLGDSNSLDFARKHKAVIDRFGRFPHRNEVLGRESTPEERDFLEEHGRGF